MELTPILIAVAIVAGLGLLLGLGLAIASVVMAVPVDKKAEEIRECLPENGLDRRPEQLLVRTVDRREH